MHKKTATPPPKSQPTFSSDYLKDRHFGNYGGRYVPELLIPALEELETAYTSAQTNKDFQKQLTELYRDFGGRPTPLTYAKNLTAHIGGAKIYLKNEGALHTGAHKLNNAMGQGLLTKQMGKKEVIAETGAGQHGLAVAATCARLNLKAKIFMGTVDIKRQYSNVYTMQRMGAEVIPVNDGSCTLKDAVNAALKYWIEHLEHAHYIIGSALGPYPFPLIVRDFQAIIGKETRQELIEREGKLPRCVLACVGGGSNALGMFSAFIEDSNIDLVAVEAGGKGPESGNHASRMIDTDVGIIQGYKSFFLQNSEGQLQNTHSISAGLDYPGIAPELAHLYEVGRIRFIRASDLESLQGYQLLGEKEGILPALESSHAITKIPELARSLNSDDILVVNVSGRGDKDLFITAPHFEKEVWKEFLKSNL